MPDNQKEKDVKYVDRDFDDLKQALVDFTKVYYPNTYNDFNATSPGMMFIEMASYVGDVMSHYTDRQIQELFLPNAQERENIVELAQGLGYKPKPATAATTTLDVYQKVPAKGSGDNTEPDYRYALDIDEDMIVSSVSDPSIKFRTLESVDFSVSSSNDPTEVSVHEVDEGSGEVSFYALKKQVKAQAGEVVTREYSFGEPERFPTILLPHEDIIDIVDIRDSDGNRWSEVDYLAQETVFEEIKNTAANDQELSQYNDTTPYLLKLKKTPRRFQTRIKSNNKTEIQFGAGVSDSPDEELVPTPDAIGDVLPHTPKAIDTSFDPSNFMYTKAYGQVPANTTLTVRYTRGGGIESNVPSEDLSTISEVDFSLDEDILPTGSQQMTTEVRNSVVVSNPEPATGGKGPESVEEIRQNALAYYRAQNRAVTKEDYIVRSYALPSKYGNLAKVYIVQDQQLNDSDSTIIKGEGETRSGRPTGKNNPLALNLYTLGYDNQGRLTELNKATKENLQTYLSQYRMLTDAVNIKDAWIINIEVEFEIVTLNNFNKREVKLQAIEAVKDFFSIDRWQINQPINLSELQLKVAEINGVQAVTHLDVNNVYDTNEGYSGNVYDLSEATRDSVIYPSLDPSIFELRYPNKDIKVSAR